MPSETLSVLAENGPLVDLSSTYGPMLIGLLFSAGLLGIVICQTWNYHNNFPKDRPILKSMVYYVVFMEALRLGFSVHAIYYYLVAKWGNPFALAHLGWTSEIFLLLAALTEVAVRLYFAYRVWIISQRNLYIIIPLVTLCLAHLSAAVATWILSFFNPVLSDYSIALRRLGHASLALSVTTDWCISLSLIYFLHRNRSGMSKTDTIINRIVFYTVNMGLFTSCFDICVLALSLRSPPHPQLYDIALYQVVANLYANSLLASLNSRISLRQNVSVNEAISDYSAFEAQPGNVTESAFRPNMCSGQSQVSTSTGQFPSMANVSSVEKHEGQGCQSGSV